MWFLQHMKNVILAKPSSSPVSNRSCRHLTVPYNAGPIQKPIFCSSNILLFGQLGKWSNNNTQASRSFEWFSLWLKRVMPVDTDIIGCTCGSASIDLTQAVLLCNVRPHVNILLADAANLDGRRPSHSLRSLSLNVCKYSRSAVTL